RTFAPVLESVPVGFIFRKEVVLSVLRQGGRFFAFFTCGVAAREDRRHFGRGWSSFRSLENDSRSTSFARAQCFTEINFKINFVFISASHFRGIKPRRFLVSF
ncbi:MAG: hypothetical protein K2O53_03395, partial [Bacteroidales bacterium]|nr:hypothetical protein [Bacteroidales bacterium]